MTMDSINYISVYVVPNTEVDSPHDNKSEHKLNVCIAMTVSGINTVSVFPKTDVDSPGNNWIDGTLPTHSDCL